MKSLYQTTLEETLRNKKLRLDGQHIAIPFPFPRFSKYFPGIMKRRYYIVTANSKVGKSKITDFLFVIAPFLFSKNISTNIKPKITYFSLEQSKEDKIKEIRSFLLFYKHGITLSPDYVDSIYTGHILDDNVERILQSDAFNQFFEEFEKVVTYEDFTRNPFGIYKHVRRIAHKSGYYTDAEGRRMDMSIPQKMDIPGYSLSTQDKIDLEDFHKSINLYHPDDPDEYNIVVIDHARLLSQEKDLDDRRNLEKFSSDYLMAIRDRWSFIPVLVAQQAAGQESVENMKADKLRPSADGIGIAKNIQQDCDTLLGLFAPARHKKTTWEHYDITQLRDSHRELSVVFNRRGQSVITQLYFNGAANYFKELPPSSDMSKDVYSRVSRHSLTNRNLYEKEN